MGFVYIFVLVGEICHREIMSFKKVSRNLITGIDRSKNPATLVIVLRYNIYAMVQEALAQSVYDAAVSRS